MKICVMLTKYPVFSETFIAREILGLQRAGHSVRIAALDSWPWNRPNTIHAEIDAEIVHLSLLRPAHLVAVFRVWQRLRQQPVWDEVLALFHEDVRLIGRPAAIIALGKAMVWFQFGDASFPEVIYAHWISRPASVARYAACLSGVPWCCSAHARDVWTAKPGVLRSRLASAWRTVTCNSQAYTSLQQATDRPDTVYLSHHGLDLLRFSPPMREKPSGSDHRPLTILTVGRAVPKKGFDTLLRALARVPSDIDWRMQHAGSGLGRYRLWWLAWRLGISRRVDWMGPIPSRQLLECYRRADLFVLASQVDRKGDQDGLPNVVVEACSQGLPCVSTRLPSIEDLIVDGSNGLLVPPGDPAGLAKAIEGLARDPGLRQRMGQAAERRVREQFDCEASIKLVCQLLEKTAQQGPRV